MRRYNVRLLRSKFCGERGVPARTPTLNLVNARGAIYSEKGVPNFIDGIPIYSGRPLRMNIEVP